VRHFAVRRGFQIRGLVGVSLAVALSLSCKPDAAADNTAIEAAIAAWADAFNSRDPKRVVALYDSEAVFWGTTSQVLRATPTEIADYFKGMPDRPQARCVLGEHRTRRFGEIAVSSGYYTFSNPRADGTVESSPSRFSFTYRLRNGTWWIVDHHSSRMPPPPP
jgi:uncharacterized protein (TIGR02246 family)